MSKLKSEGCEITMPFYEIRISVTGACNQRCIYCGPFTDGKYDKGYQNLSLKQAGRLAAALGGIIRKLGLHVQITGGEPTLRRELPEIVGVLRDYGIEDIGLTTNGSFLTTELAKELVEKGVSDFHVHIPSLDEKAYVKTTGRKIDSDGIRGILSSVIIVIEQGARAEFNVPVTSVNIATLPELFNFCYDHRINLKLIEELNADDKQIKVESIKAALSEWGSAKGLMMGGMIIRNRYGLIYQFQEGFFFRVAPVSSEFRANLKDRGGKVLLDGRYWIGSGGEEYLFTPSYFLDPEIGTIDHVKARLEDVVEIYDWSIRR